MKHANTITGHIQDLLRRDIKVAYDCSQWLTPAQRDIDRRLRPKRLANRYIASCIVVAAADNPSFAKELLDRTEGKIAQQVNVSGEVNHVVRLEHARQRILDHLERTGEVNTVAALLLAHQNEHTQEAQASQAVDGEAHSASELETGSSGSAVNSVPEGQAPGGMLPGSIGREAETVTDPYRRELEESEEEKEEGTMGNGKDKKKDEAEEAERERDSEEGGSDEETEEEGEEDESGG